ncbi:MAG TPA: HU family DNA-binding protein [Bryobacteraceae bacterium]|nr:HU family DNA-binding protein [Bryobacteraceae bacterium]
MNKRDLVDEIAAQSRLTKLQAGRALNSFMRVVQSSLVRGERVTLVGFGTFAISRRKARHVRDPQSGTTMQIRARSVARFAPGLELKMAIDEADKLHGPDHTSFSRPS